MNNKNIYLIIIGVLLLIFIIYVGSNVIDNNNNNLPIDINIELEEDNLNIELNEIYDDNQYYDYSEYIKIYSETNTTEPGPSDDASHQKITEGESIVISDFDCKNDRIYVSMDNRLVLHYPANQSC